MPTTLAALLDHVGWESAHLVGTSFGAEVALEFAAGRPERVRSLVVITAMDRETPAFRRGSDEMRALLARRVADGDATEFYDLLVQGVYSAAYRARGGGDPGGPPRPRPDCCPKPGSRASIACSRHSRISISPPRLARIRCPALALLAADDRIMDGERRQRPGGGDRRRGRRPPDLGPRPGGRGSRLGRRRLPHLSQPPGALPPMKTIYLAAYHQSRFGKLGAATVPELIEAAVLGACDEIGAEAGADRRRLGRRGL